MCATNMFQHISGVFHALQAVRSIAVVMRCGIKLCCVALRRSHSLIFVPTLVVPGKLFAVCCVNILQHISVDFQDWMQFDQPHWFSKCGSPLFICASPNALIFVLTLVAPGKSA